MESMKPKFQRFDWYNLIAALICLVIGVVILIRPSESSMVLVYVISGLIALAGLLRTILYFARHESVSPFAIGGLSIGLSLLAIGIFLLLAPKVLILVLPVTLGCMLIFSGFGSLQTAVELFRLHIRRWYIPLIFSLASLICGFIALINPFSTASVLMVFLGIALCGEGLLLLISVLLFCPREPRQPKVR